MTTKDDKPDVDVDATEADVAGDGAAYSWKDISRDGQHMHTPALAAGDLFALDSRGAMGISEDGEYIGFEIMIAVSLRCAPLLAGAGLTEKDRKELGVAVMLEALHSLENALERSRAELTQVDA